MKIQAKIVPSVNSRLSQKAMTILRILHAKTGYNQMQLIEWAVIEFEKHLEIEGNTCPAVSQEGKK